MSEENILGTRPIPQLALKFGIPSIVSMLVNSIYNLVDQIFRRVIPGTLFEAFRCYGAGFALCH